jgi:hypothetical protein
MNRSAIHVPLLLGVALVVVAAFAAPALAQETAGERNPDDQGLWEEIRRLYEEAKDAGEQVPEDVVEWVKLDFQKIGDWEYRVVTVPRKNDETLEETLTELGADRWECFWVEPTGNKLRLLLKRPSRSYLKMIPLSQLLKLVPGGGGEGGD